MAEAERCRLGHSTVGRWLNEAGDTAEGQVKGIVHGDTRFGSRLGADGLWVRSARGERFGCC